MKVQFRQDQTISQGLLDEIECNDKAHLPLWNVAE